jgi:hypothetical protein
LANGLALACVTRYRYALVKMNCFSDFDKPAVVQMNTGLIDRCYATKLVVGKAIGATPKVLRNPNRITRSQRNVSPLGELEAVGLGQRQKRLFPGS